MKIENVVISEWNKPSWKSTYDVSSATKCTPNALSNVSFG